MRPENSVPPSPRGNPYLSTASGLLKVLDRLRNLHQDMTLLQAMTLLYVAQNPDASQRVLHTSIGASDSVTARTLAILTNVGGRNVAPLGLVISEMNEEDRRERVLNLSPKGRKLLDDIVRDLS